MGTVSKLGHRGLWLGQGSSSGAGAGLDPSTALGIPGQLGSLGGKLSNAEPKFS